MSYAIAYSRSTCEILYERIAKKTEENFVAISNKSELNINKLKTLNPKYIFFHIGHI